jgi:hypothetical protein
MYREIAWLPTDRGGFGWILYRQKRRKTAVFWTLLDVCGEVDGAGDGVELTEIQQLNQCIKQDAVNLDAVRYTVNAKGRSVRFHEHLTISQISSIGPAVKGASKWV